jgi:hypothetical protein
MHAFRLNQTGKSSFREVYHDHENHDYDHENDSPAFHDVMVHSIHHPRHIATSFQTFKPTFRVKIGTAFLKSLLQSSKVAPKIEPIGATKQSLEASTLCASSDCLVLMVTLFFHATFEDCNKPYFFQHCHFWHFFAPSTASTGPK